MPTMKLTVSGEKIRNFMALRIKEIDRQIERGQAALQTLRSQLEQIAENAKVHFEQAQAHMMSPPIGVSALGGAGGRYVGQAGMLLEQGGVQHVRNTLGKVENSIAELAYRKSHVIWLSEQFSPDVGYELDAADMGMLGIVPSMLSGFAAGAYAVGNDPFDLAMLC